VLALIWVDIAELKDDIAELTSGVTQLDDGLKALEARTGQISRIAAIVECLTPSFHWFLMTKCRPGTIPVEQAGTHRWRLWPSSWGMIPQNHQYVFLISL
jgi:X-X-X-Leu-X-X-Gly heptad repeat protein